MGGRTTYGGVRSALRGTVWIGALEGRREGKKWAFVPTLCMRMGESDWLQEIHVSAVLECTSGIWIDSS